MFSNSRKKKTQSTAEAGHTLTAEKTNKTIFLFLIFSYACSFSMAPLLPPPCVRPKVVHRATRTRWKKWHIYPNNYANYAPPLLLSVVFLLLLPSELPFPPQKETTQSVRCSFTLCCGDECCYIFLVDSFSHNVNSSEKSTCDCAYVCVCACFCGCGVVCSTVVDFGSSHTIMVAFASRYSSPIFVRLFSFPVLSSYPSTRRDGFTL